MANFKSPLVWGTLIRRYKRFLADVEFGDGSIQTVHCPNTGRMTGCAVPGCKVGLLNVAGGKRKYDYRWVLSEVDQQLICIDSAYANQVVVEAIKSGSLPEFAGFDLLQTEIKHASGCRFDVGLTFGPLQTLLEIKSVTLKGEESDGYFPDAPSMRGAKHLNTLADSVAETTRCVQLYLVMHNGIDSVSAAVDIDPKYAQALDAAVAVGVEVLAYRGRVSSAGVIVDGALPVTTG